MEKWILKFAALILVSTFVFINSSAVIAQNAKKLGTPLPPPKKKEAVTTSNKQQSPAQIDTRNYKAPTSYDEAYKWRTGKAESLITKLKNNKNVDSMRMSNTFGYIKKIVQEINDNAKSDFEKAKMAHDITALVLKYDAANYWKGTVPEQDFISVLKSGTAVCEGYANTYKKFCDELHLPCQVIHGYARGVGTSLLSEKDVTDSNHAWNMVQINEAWYLVDCTWNSGFMQGRSAKQQYSTEWLFTKPEHYIHSHFPTHQNRQLLSSPISPEQFGKLPELRPRFFDAARDFKSNLQKINNCDGIFNLEYDLTDGHEISFTVENISSNTNIANCNFIKEEDAHINAMFSFPKAGTYSIKIFCKTESEKVGSLCGEFLVESDSASAIRYPTIYANYGKDATIINPISMPLKQDTAQKFYVASSKKFVFIIIGKSHSMLESDGKGNFFGEIKIPKGTKQLSVAVSEKENGSGSIVATYSVE